MTTVVALAIADAAGTFTTTDWIVHPHHTMSWACNRTTRATRNGSDS